MKILDWIRIRVQANRRELPAGSTEVSAREGSVAVNQNPGSIVVTNVVANVDVPQRAIEQFAATLGLEPFDAKRVSAEYLQDIQTYHQYLPLKGMGDNSGLRLRFPLVDLFVPLNARMTLPDADTLSDELRLAGKRLSEEERQGIGGRAGEPMPILTLVEEQPVLVVLGDPGSGKSTLTRFMAYALATGQGAQWG